jgi:hypothetical protein
MTTRFVSGISRRRSPKVLSYLTLVEGIGLLALSIFLFGTPFGLFGPPLLISAILYLVASGRIRRGEGGVGFVVAAFIVSVPPLAILTHFFLLFADPLFIAIGLALIGIGGTMIAMIIQGRSQPSSGDVSRVR